MLNVSRSRLPFLTTLGCQGAVVLLITACAADPDERLPEGRWTGSLQPMNHPEAATSIGYEVAYSNRELALSVLGPDGTVLPARGASLVDDTLRFTFDEPERGAPLRCVLVRDPAGDRLAGRCTDDAGKWATFTMVAPR